MLCPYCKREIVDEAAFCPYCGQATQIGKQAGNEPSGPSGSDDGATGPLPPIDDDALPTDVPDITLDEYNDRQLALRDASGQQRGRRRQGASLPTAAEHRSKQRRRSRLGTVAGMMIAAGVVIIAAVAIMRLVPAQQTQTTASEAASEAAASAEPQTWTDITDQVSDGVVQTDWYRVELPRALRGQTRVLCETDNPNVVTVQDEDGLLLVRLYPSGSRAADDESKVRVFSLGTAKHDNATTNVRAAFYYLSDAGDGVASWDDDATTDLALTTRHRMTAQELMEHVYLRSNDSWIPCLHAASEEETTSEADVSEPSAADAPSAASAAASAASTAAASEPFYGIYIASYQNEQKADEAAAHAREQGFDARVVVTDEWANLNSDHWYAICCGTYATQAEAESALGAVRSAGYSDAYIRFSGSRR